jgi:hypothetical protein
VKRGKEQSDKIVGSNQFIGSNSSLWLLAATEGFDEPRTRQLRHVATGQVSLLMVYVPRTAGVGQRCCHDSCVVGNL